MVSLCEIQKSLMIPIVKTKTSDSKLQSQLLTFQSMISITHKKSYVNKFTLCGCSRKRDGSDNPFSRKTAWRASIK